MSQARRRNALVAALLGAALCVAAAVVICPKCGWEVNAGEAACSHCGGVLSAPAPAPTPGGVPGATPAPAPAGPGPAAAPDVAGLATAAEQGAKLVLALAQQSQQSGDAWLAWLSGGRAYVVAALAGPAQPRLQNEALALRRAMASSVLYTRITCPACEGSGRGTMQTISMSGDRKVTETPSVPCPACAGARAFNAVKDGDTMTREIAAANDRFRIAANRIGYLQLRDLWLPTALSTNLDIRTTAQLRSALLAECPACLGLGKIGCAKCEGIGRVKCTGQGCTRGLTLCPECRGTKKVAGQAGGTLGSGGRSLRTNCRRCNALGIVACETCRGVGMIYCKGCDGVGSEICRRCKGNGQLDPCVRCDGRGYRDCAKCNGTGAYQNAPCPNCKGEKVELCPSCNGTGHRDARS